MLPKTESEKLYRVTAPHFVAGFAAEEITGVGSWVTAAAPIIRYFVSWELGAVLNYCRKKKWEVKQIKGGRDAKQ